eukprot:TRINITY_DN7590_c0_g1::TRINITY_DN7590_c0_g1_i1::g.1931::m.1931 TRINITY_DN7590_c0_g1::TRINITY_DN7590_c0_g1_i1::g.1931  ORF type:complete len:781 (-),score=109.97,sp/Q00808/HETE1_PODAS/36.36/1e-50,sp/Q00808/HETE1_PODAS/36.03/8e-50,sp/Q00808/HETE1_PODAS/34.17/4e-39,sp/Q00808/HETE1_PODAS/30.69/1e-29,sp/Q00808/HETE1_PODAS/32.00/3e-16,WD40/PF00400.27/2.3e-11,WD40/PF00400.27/6e-09,WD40/PF00400.27/0.0074,WD40/PF00400.27/1.6e-06,WD40/PF00400.27/5.9e-09,WD40/PF00400.27/1.5e-08,WD40/PF00400.27/2e-11,zf-B_bo
MYFLRMSHPSPPDDQHDLSLSLECPLCMEYYCNPVTLSCGHSLCLECTRRLVYRGTLSHEIAAGFDVSCPNTSTAETGTKSCGAIKFGFDCPVCRARTTLDGKGVDGLAPNFSLRHIVESKQKAMSSIPLCSCKQTEAKWACGPCDASLCDQCIEKHNELPWLKSHPIVPARPKGKVRKMMNCPEHEDEPLKYFCAIDECLMCRDCVQVGSHKGHSSVSLKDAAANCNTKMKYSMEDFTQIWGTVDEQYLRASKDALGLLTENFKGGVSGVTMAFEELLKQIQADRDKLLAKMESSYNTRKRYIEATMGMCNLNKQAFTQLKEDLVANEKAALNAAIEEKNGVYLESLHLYKRYQAFLQEFNCFVNAQLDLGEGGMWCQTAPWHSALAQIAGQVSSQCDKLESSNSAPVMNYGSLATTSKPKASKNPEKEKAPAAAQPNPWNHEKLAKSGVKNSPSPEASAEQKELAFEAVATLTQHTHAVRAVAYSPDGKLLVTAGDDKKVRVWNPLTGKCSATISEHGHSVLSISFSADGTRFVTTSADRTTRIWSSATFRCVGTLQHGGTSVKCASFSHDGSLIVIACDSRIAQVWSAKSFQVVASLKNQHTDALLWATFSPDDKYIATASADNTVGVWSTTSRRDGGASENDYTCIARLDEHTGSVKSAEFSTDGKFLVTASLDKTARVWGLQKSITCIAVLHHPDPVNSAAYSPDGKYIVTASADKIARVWSTRSFTCVATIQHHTASVTCAAFSPDGSCVATASEDKTARIYKKLIPGPHLQQQ